MSSTPTPSPTPFDDDVFTGNTVPAQFATNNEVPIQITVLNTGNTSWSSAGGFALEVLAANCQVKGDGAFFTTGTLSIDSLTVVAPGEQYTFEGTLLGPAAAGTCSIQVRMIHGMVAFGPTLLADIQVVDAVDNSAFAGSSLPAKLPPGAMIGIGITLRNSGTTIWSAVPGAGYSLKILDDPCGIFGGVATLSILANATVPTNQNYQFVSQITAPQSIGPCTATTQMNQDQAGTFGEVVHLSFVVAPPPNEVKDWTIFE